MKLSLFSVVYCSGICVWLYCVRKVCFTPFFFFTLPSHLPPTLRKAMKGLLSVYKRVILFHFPLPFVCMFVKKKSHPP